MPTNLRKRLQQGELVLGTILSLNSPDVAEILSGIGFDWLFIDAEHSTLDPHHLQAIFQATRDSIPCVVRIPALDEIVVKKTLDAGAAGVLVPQVHTAEQAGQLRAIHFGILLQPRQRRRVSFKFLHHLTLQVGSPEDCHDFK